LIGGTKRGDNKILETGKQRFSLVVERRARDRHASLKRSGNDMLAFTT
jgi:hypothetical protein